MSSADLVKVHVRVPSNPRWEFQGERLESLWARPVGPGLYQLDNIPSADHQLNYLDVVRVKEGVSGHGDALEVIGIHNRGGQTTFDLHFPELGIFAMGKKRARRALLDTVKGDLNGTLERFGDDWYGASIPKERKRDAIELFDHALQSDVLTMFGTSGHGDRWSGMDR